MRTATPENIRDAFLGGLGDVRSTFAAVAAAPLSPSNRKLISEYTFLGASVLLEGFIGDLFVAYINKKDTAFVGFLTNKMEVKTADDFAKRATSFVTVGISSHLTLDQIRSVLDPRDFNITFPSSSDLRSKAEQWLENPYQSYFLNLSNNHCAIIDTTKAIRNYLAHRSGAARSTMQSRLQDARLAPDLRRGANEVHSVGAFLESKATSAGNSRGELYLAELQLIANSLCP